MQNGQGSDGLNERSLHRNLYKLLGNVDLTGCNKNIVPEVKSTQLRISRYKPNRLFFVELTQPCYGTRGWNTLVKRDFEPCTTKVWSKVFLIVIWKSIFVNIAYMENKIRLDSQLELQGKK
jgi:hypothetical protein